MSDLVHEQVRARVRYARRVRGQMSATVISRGEVSVEGGQMSYRRTRTPTTTCFIVYHPSQLPLQCITSRVVSVLYANGSLRRSTVCVSGGVDSRDCRNNFTSHRGCLARARPTTTPAYSADRQVITAKSLFFFFFFATQAHFRVLSRR